MYLRLMYTKLYERLNRASHLISLNEKMKRYEMRVPKLLRKMILMFVILVLSILLESMILTSCKGVVALATKFLTMWHIKSAAPLRQGIQGTGKE